MFNASRSKTSSLSKYVAEFFGTFTLTLVVFLSIVGPVPLATPILAGLVVALFVYGVGGISGAHLNPAITIAMLSIQKISWKDSILYIFVQFLGAGCAMLLAKGLTGATTMLIVRPNVMVAIAEAIGALFLSFAVASVTIKKIDASIAGVFVGGFLFVGIIVASTNSNESGRSIWITFFLHYVRSWTNCWCHLWSIPRMFSSWRKGEEYFCAPIRYAFE